MSAFGTYLLGFFILIIGLAVAAYLLNVPTMWILVGVIILVGIGIILASRRAKPTHPPTTGGGYPPGGGPPAGGSGYGPGGYPPGGNPPAGPRV